MALFQWKGVVGTRKLWPVTLVMHCIDALHNIPQEPIACLCTIENYSFLQYLKILLNFRFHPIAVTREADQSFDVIVHVL